MSILVYYFAPVRGVKYCDKRVCLYVCLSTRVSQKPRIQISQNFLHMLLVAVAQSYCDGSAIRYVLPVLWMTSGFRIMLGIA